MRILVVGINYAPETISTGKYTTEMCEWLVAKGHVVRVIAAPPYYPDWKVANDYLRCGYLKEARNGVEIHRCPIWVPAKPRGLTRVLHLASFALSSTIAMARSIRWNADWIINVAPTLASAPSAYCLARLTGAKSWLHIQDFEIDAALNLGMVKPGLLKKVASILERELICRFDRVSAISPAMITKLLSKGVKERRAVLFPNWVDVHQIQPLQGPSPFRSALGIPEDSIVCMYSGNMGHKQGLEILKEVAQLLSTRDENIHFVFGGEGPMRQMLEESCGHLPNVHFSPLQPPERLNEWLGLADIHLLPQRADVADLVMPSKLTGMFASGRPILATANPGTAVAEAVKACGLTTTPEHAQEFAEAILRLAQDKTLRVELGGAARRQAEIHLSLDATLTQFESNLNHK